jgi:hypothetical protein
MTSIRRMLVVAATLALGLAVAPALAAGTAYVTQDSTLYAKPSSSSAPVNDVDGGTTVTVLTCQGSYCKLQVPGPDGWIKANRLASVVNGKPSSKVPFNFGLFVGPDGKPSVSIGIGNAPTPRPLPVPVENDEVCFYRGANFTGSSFCVEPGDSDEYLDGKWDDSISSIEVSGEARVVVCSDEELEGTCANILSSKRNLPDALDDEISSYAVN